MQIKTTMRYHLTLVRMVIIKKSTNKWWRECEEKGTLLHFRRECKLIKPLWRTVRRFPEKLRLGDFPCGPVVTTLLCNMRAQVQFLVREIRSHISGVTKPLCCNYWVHFPQLLSPLSTTTEHMGCNFWSSCTLESACCNYWDLWPQQKGLCATIKDPAQCNEGPTWLN